MEVWGGPSRYSDVPRVRAYEGALPAAALGVEFDTDIEPDPGCPPGQPQWTGGRPGVQLVNGFARLPVTRVRLQTGSDE